MPVHLTKAPTKFKNFSHLHLKIEQFNPLLYLQSPPIKVIQMDNPTKIIILITNVNYSSNL